MKVEVKVRMLAAGIRSLYLEYYETGFRKRENLHLYLVPDDAPNARKLNEQTLRKAQEIQAQRILTPPSFEKKEKREENERAKNMRNYRNRRQIKTNGGRLAAYTLVLFEETVKAIFNKAVHDGSSAR